MRARELVVVRGTPSETLRGALEVVADLPAADVVWVSSAAAPEPFAAVAPGAVERWLGRSCDAVVLDLHEDLDADVVGQVHGFVRGGGALVLRLPPPGAVRRAGRGRLAAWPFGPEAVGERFDGRFEVTLRGAPKGEPRRLGPADRAAGGTAEQARVVEALAGLFAGPEPGCAVLVADRGRGKSSALGLAIAAGKPAGRIVVTAGEEAAAAEVFRFAVEQGVEPQYVAPMALATEGVAADVVVVDEAAQLPVPVLQRIVARHPHARLALATTARGYEGTGRGFMLRFLGWLRTQRRPLTELTLETPIRWAPGDPLERFVFEALMLDAAAAELGPEPDTEFSACAFDRDALVADKQALTEAFGLLVHAHYRTTPEDLHRLLDAPNLDVHGVRSARSGRVAAVTLVAREGGLPLDVCEAVTRGRTRLRAHALPDALMAHLGHAEAGALRMARSVRIAVHPELRRHGLATMLVEHVHRSYDVDLFGTLFGATAELLAFRFGLGYRVVRVSASRGARTGEPAVLMVRPASARGAALVERLRAELAEDLPAQLELLAGDGELLLDPALAEALGAGLARGGALAPERVVALVRAYADGPRTLESVAGAIRAFVEAHPEAGAGLAPRERRLLAARVVEGQVWAAAARGAGLPHARAAMREMRRVVRKMVVALDAGGQAGGGRGPAGS